MVKMRNILSLEAKGCDYAPRIPEPYHPRAANAPLCVSILIHEVPADDDGTGGEAAHGDKTYTEVLHVEVVVDGKEDCKTDHGD